MPQSLADGPWRQANLDAGANMVIPVPAPLGGALVIGESVIAYIAKGQTTKATPIKPTTIKVGLPAIVLRIAWEFGLGLCT